MGTVGSLCIEDYIRVLEGTGQGGDCVAFTLDPGSVEGTECLEYARLERHRLEAQSHPGVHSL